MVFMMMLLAGYLLWQVVDVVGDGYDAASDGDNDDEVDNLANVEKESHWGGGCLPQLAVGDVEDDVVLVVFVVVDEDEEVNDDDSLRRWMSAPASSW